MLLVVSASGHLVRLPLSEPLTEQTDLDGLDKLRGIARAPSPLAALGYFIGDDPQGVHTFRPLPAAMLWAEWHLWGFRRWPYLLVNVAWLIGTAAVLLRLATAVGLPAAAGVLSGVVLLARVTTGSLGACHSIATRHDLTCVLFALLSLLVLLRYLENGRQRDLWVSGGWALLAYLSKEMALALLPLTWLVCWCLPGVRGGALRRRLAAAGLGLAVAVLWFGWFQLARAHMPGGDPPAHSFSGLWQRLQIGPVVTALQFVYVLCWPLGDTIRQLIAVDLATLVWTTLFWRSATGAVVAVLIGVLLWRRQRRCLVMVYLWKVCCDLPVLPLHDVWPWYLYMPHALDPLLSGALATVAWTHWQQRRSRQSAKACNSAQLENACCGESPDAGTPTTRTP